jgi:hypothetical protein
MYCVRLQQADGEAQRAYDSTSMRLRKKQQQLDRCADGGCSRAAQPQTTGVQPCSLTLLAQPAALSEPIVPPLLPHSVVPGHVVSEACQEEVMQFKIAFNKNIYRNKRIGGLQWWQACKEDAVVGCLSGRMCWQCTQSRSSCSH